MRGMNPDAWLKAANVRNRREGCQDLITPAIVASLHDCSCVCFPFPTSPHLVLALGGEWIEAVEQNHIVPHFPIIPAKCDSVYFGTPTLVGGKPLFPGWGEGWTAETELVWTRELMRVAFDRKLR